MLYVIYGSDREKGRTKLRALREKFTREGMALEIIKESTICQELFDRMSVSQGLFSGKTLFVFDNVLEKKEDQELFFSNTTLLCESENEVIVLEPTFTKTHIARVKHERVECIECASSEKSFGGAFNIFSLGDALGMRDKKKLWVLYQEALGQDISPEEISGTLFWALKNIALMQHAKPGDSAGLNPFVAKKARSFAKNYSQEEVAKYSNTLTRAYHQAHLGEEDFSVALEKFILSI